MLKVTYFIILTVYLSALFVIFLYSLVQLHLVWRYRKARKTQPHEEQPELSDDQLPFVTIQLPVFNEKYVVERLIDQVATFDYPIDKFEIQVLDDSTDESFDIAAKKVNQISETGIYISHVKRPDRKGYKAGALQYGLATAKGDYVAIFDADFLPKADFLRRTLPYFKDKEIGMVQTRWGHLNEDYSLLTKVQAFQLNAHFTVEQYGRNSSGFFINFNGTAGIWRKETILDAGGWEADTLTEDLDLSYRSQMKGWKFKFLEDVEAPAELPAVMSAIKSQQYRWMKGGAETARKLFKQVKAANITTMQKLHGFAHLFSSSIFLFVFITALISVPALWLKIQLPELNYLFHIGGVFFIAFLILSVFYSYSLHIKSKSKLSRFVYFMKTFPAFICLSMGLALHNSVAVWRGYRGQRSAFIRTPKFNIEKMTDEWKNNKYIKSKLDWIFVFEGLLFLYFLGALVTGIALGDFGFIPLHLMLSVGYGLIFYYTLQHKRLSSAGS